MPRRAKRRLISRQATLKLAASSELPTQSGWARLIFAVRVWGARVSGGPLVFGEIQVERRFSSLDGVALRVDPLTLTHRRNLAADDVQFVVERSTDLQTWLIGPTEVILVAETRNSDGTANYVWRSAHLFDETPHEFLRLRVVKP